ncbi:MAG: hypothetical protein QXY86_02065 [Candidatus Micrarchaeaceae archaeon]
MKIAIPTDFDKRLVPLDAAMYVYLYDDQTGVLHEHENGGFGSKEATMAEILSMNPDAITIRPGMLCPGSYAMSKGALEYAKVNSETLDEILKNKEYEKNIVDDLEPEFYAEHE